MISTIILAKVPLHCDEFHLFVSEDESSVKYILDKPTSVVSIGATDKRVWVPISLSVNFFVTQINVRRRFS